MTDQRRATPEQWRSTEKYANATPGCYSDSCILELRDRLNSLEKQLEFKTANSALFAQDVLQQFDALVERIEALEQRPIPGTVELRSSAPAGGLWSAMADLSPAARAVLDAVNHAPLCGEIAAAIRAAAYQVVPQHPTLVEGGRTYEEAWTATVHDDIRRRFLAIAAELEDSNG